MKIILEIPDNKVQFFMELLKNFSFVKKATSLSDAKTDLFQSLKESAREVKLHKQGKIKLKSAQDLLNEL